MAKDTDKDIETGEAGETGETGETEAAPLTPGDLVLAQRGLSITYSDGTAYTGYLGARVLLPGNVYVYASGQADDWSAAAFLKTSKNVEIFVGEDAFNANRKSFGEAATVMGASVKDATPEEMCELYYSAMRGRGRKSKG